jgi:hypothetical protein
VNLCLEVRISQSSNFVCTIVNFGFAERENQENIDWTIVQSQIHNQHELLEEELRRSAAASISLLWNNSDSDRFQELERPIPQKSRNICYEAVFVVAKSLEMEQLNPNL